MSARLCGVCGRLPGEHPHAFCEAWRAKSLQREAYEAGMRFGRELLKQRGETMAEPKEKLPETAEEWRVFLDDHALTFTPSALARLREAVEELAQREAGGVRVGEQT